MKTCVLACIRKLWRQLPPRRLPASVRFRSVKASMEDYSLGSSAPQVQYGKIDDLSSRVADAIDGASNWLPSQQQEDAYRTGELEADTTLESDYIVMHVPLGTGDQERFQKC